MYICCLVSHTDSASSWTSDMMHTAQKKTTIDQVTTMLAPSKSVLFPGHNHLLTTGADDPALTGAQAIIKVLGHQYR